jgi:hypothetical protein
MSRTIAVLILVICGVTISQAQTVSLKGTVAKIGGMSGLPGVTVRLVRFPDLSVTTGSDGTFSITGTSPVIAGEKRSPPFRFTLKGNTVVFSNIPQNARAGVDIFSLSGKTKKATVFHELPHGKQIVTLSKFSSGINIMRISINGEQYTQPLVSVGNTLYLKNESPNLERRGSFVIAKQAAASAVDTLMAEKEGYLVKKTAIESYSKQGIHLALDSCAGCTGVALQAAIDSYIAAQTAGDPAKMALATDVKVVENRKSATLAQSIASKALSIDFHRSIMDVDSCRTFTEVIVANNHSYVIGTRLRVNNGTITEIDAIVTDTNNGWMYNAGNYLKYSKRQDWYILPLNERSTRKALVDAGSAYFLLFKGVTEGIPWGAPCERLEGGGLFTNPNNNNADNCKTTISGNLDILNKDFVVDVDMGTVHVFCTFGATMPDSHMFRLVNGKYRYIHTLSVQ